MLVGMMMASEVPTHSCMRTASGTSKMRNTSNSTGTITAPPPTPNSPANSPVATPANANRRREPKQLAHRMSEDHGGCSEVDCDNWQVLMSLRFSVLDQAFPSSAYPQT